MDIPLVSTVSMFLSIFVVVAITFAFSKTKWFEVYIEGKFNPKNSLVLIVVFGILSIIASHYMSANYNSALISVRDLPALIAGFVGGPVTGIGAGLIGGIERYLEGGATALPCMIGTIVAGLIGGLVWWIAGKKYPKLWLAAIAMLIVEVIHLTTAYFISDMSTGIDVQDIVLTSTIPMLLFNTLGIIIMTLVYNRYIRTDGN